MRKPDYDCLMTEFYAMQGSRVTFVNKGPAGMLEKYRQYALVGVNPNAIGPITCGEREIADEEYSYQPLALLQQVDGDDQINLISLSLVIERIRRNEMLEYWW